MAGLNSSEVNIILSNNQIKKRQATKASYLLGHSNNNIKKLQNLNKKINNQSNPFLRQKLRNERRKERRTLNLSKNKYNDIDNLERLIEEKNAAAKDAEGELILFIKNEPPYKDKFNRDDIILSIDKIKHIDIDNSKYPNLLEWKEIHEELESFIDNLPNNTNINYNKNRIIAEGRDYGFDVDAILEKLPQRSFLNRLPKLPKIFTRKNTAKSDLPIQQNPQQNSSIRPVTPVSKPWYQLWGGARKTHRKPSGSRGGNPYSGMKLQDIEAAKIEAKRALADAKFQYQRVAELYKQNPQSYQQMAFKHTDAIQNAKNALNDIESAEEKALQQQTQAPPRSSWLPWGGRKTHHKKRHMRKGSRKIHRK